MALLGMIILPLVFSLLFAYLLSPVVLYLEKQRIPRRWGILVVYFLIIVFLCASIIGVLHDLLDEIQKMAALLPAYIEQLTGQLEHWQQDYRRVNIPPLIRQIINRNLEQLQLTLASRLEKISNTVINMLGQLLSLILVPILTFYFIKDGKKFKSRIIMALPQNYRQQVLTAINDISDTIGCYLRGVMLIGFLVGTMVYVGLTLLGLEEFSLLLGVFNGLTNLIPYFGPFIGAVPVVVIALLQSPSLALQAVVLIIAVQQVESLVLTPQILGRTLGFHPVTVIFLILVGSMLFGFLGLIFAVPVAALFRTCWKHLKILNFPLR